jgi:DNA polymerase-3 subunit alpha
MYHVHTNRSARDGVNTVEDVVKCAAESGATYLAVTDHGTCAGWFELEKYCKKYNIKPVFGVEGYVITASGRKHITICAKNQRGLRQLSKLHSATENVSGKPVINVDMLTEHTIVGSACVSTWFTDKKLFEKILNIVGRNNVLCEVMPLDGVSHEANVEKLKIAKEYDLKTITSPDAHYDTQSRNLYNLLAKTNGYTSDGMDLSIRNISVAKEYGFKEYNIGDEFDNVELTKPDMIAIEDADVKLASMVKSSPFWKTQRKRCIEELSLIINKGFSSYFLVVADIISTAKSIGIKVGAGRGSACGSLIAYILGITTVNPIEYDLMFWRFLSPDRIEYPDIDIDIQASRRDELVSVIGKKYPTTMQLTNYTFYKEKSFNNALARVGIFGKKEDASNVIQSKGPHPAGIIIPTKDVSNYYPCMDGMVELDMREAEEFGFVKIDLLALSFLDSVQTNYIPDDKSLVKKALDILDSGKTSGAFQLSSKLAKNTAKGNIKSISDIAQVISVIRPGALDSGIKDAWLNHDHCGIGGVDMTDTRNCLIYQEQLMKLFLNLDFTVLETEKMRKAVGKKKMDKLKVFEGDFISRYMEHENVSEDDARQVWERLLNFGSYGFNKSHAVAYAINALIGACNEVQHREEYVAALLSNSNPAEVAEIVSEKSEYDYYWPDSRCCFKKWWVIGNMKIMAPLKLFKGATPNHFYDIKNAIIEMSSNDVENYLKAELAFPIATKLKRF